MIVSGKVSADIPAYSGMQAYVKVFKMEHLRSRNAQSRVLLVLGRTCEG